MRTIPLLTLLTIAALAGCAKTHSQTRATGVGPRPGDTDAAIGDRGPQRSDPMSNSSPAPSVEPNTADRENAPIPR